jgi:AAHS family 3-hydroxyphenylpropionic acid transporter
LALCFLVAVLEGVDLQSTGVAAPRMAHEFGLSVSQLGLAFSAGMFGLLPGAKASASRQSMPASSVR